jgi:hypothetical protein
MLEKKSRFRMVYLASLTGLLACGAPGTTPTEPVTSLTESISAATAARPRVSATRKPDAAPLVTAPPGLLQYYGGPIIGDVYVLNVNWNNNVDARIQQNMAYFYEALGTSAMWPFLNSEYNTNINATAGNQKGSAGSQQSIGFASATDTYSLGLATSKTITDANIQSALQTALASGPLGPNPAPTVNNIYMVNMPPGSSVTNAGGQQSCVTKGFCAYHSSFNYNGVNVKYAVLMDTSVDCASGCGSNSDYLNNFTSTASHELIESVTDPLGVSLNYPDAWSTTPAYFKSSNNTEIGDICNQRQYNLEWGTKADGTAWVAQQEYDNVNGGCAAPCAPVSCAAAGANCGTISDHCGNTLSCGTCSGGAICGTSEYPNDCCTPRTTCDNSCGSVPDNCGGTISCGCQSGQVCVNSVCTYPTSGGGGGGGHCTGECCGLRGKAQQACLCEAGGGYWNGATCS